MSICIDSSVLVAAMVGAERHHEACRSLVVSGKAGIYSHGITETFSTLTGGRRAFRLPADLVAELLKKHFIPCLKIGALSATDVLVALQECKLRGVRGGAVFDYLHLMSASKAGVSKFYTLDISNFRAFHRSGDPEIVEP